MKVLNKTMKFIALLLIILTQFIFISVPKAYAATSPSLGTADSFSVLAGSSVTNTGSTTIDGDVGIYPGAGLPPNVTGWGSVTLGGTLYDVDGGGVAAAAQADMNAVYTTDLDQTCNTTYEGAFKELAGLTLVPGVYCATSFHLSSGTLTLNGTNSDVWIFKSASDLIITGGSSAKVVFTGGGQPCNVWWRVVSTATFDANSSLVGNILADTSITFAAGASLNGRALARTAAVTLSSNSISGPTCEAAASPTPTPTPTPTSDSTSGSTSSTTGGEASCIESEAAVVPTIIESRRVDADSIYISWGPYSGTDRFNVRYGPTNGNWLYNTDVTGFSTTINALPSNQSIWIQVAARSNCSLGAYGAPKLVGGGVTSTGQVLGASTLASTGAGNSKLGVILMLLGAGIALTSFYALKKNSL